MSDETTTEYGRDDIILKPLADYDYHDDSWGTELRQLSGSIGYRAKPFDKQQIRLIMEKSFPVK